MGARTFSTAERNEERWEAELAEQTDSAHIVNQSDAGRGEGKHKGHSAHNSCQEVGEEVQSWMQLR